ncbi:TlpA family protein disulfide reductase [Natronosporangium hydrolyticum]|uniref:TlpA family protein disulfide reductase n=2 Tax=Natronosporangium hydrolyticum TaxID=2811111 RepID=A0A895YKB1_9ACTN|nr:TlpA family protein disulfide reductase [Natronosporangium hydrolyticum]
MAMAAALLLAACGNDGGGEPVDDGGPPEVASPLAECDELTAPPDGESPPAAGGEPSPGGGTDQLPELTLPCFTGDEPVELTALRGPAVVNLWASWCPPCREELPALQRYADLTTGQVHVVGVVSEDTRPRAASLAEDLALDFPSLYDRGGDLLASLGLMNLPITLFIDDAGELVYLHLARPYDAAELAELVAEHLGVPPPEGLA